MYFANPIWLWGLAGLLVPLAVHLLSRKEGKVIPFGSIRFLTESPTTQFRSIRINEIGLLILRSILIALLVFYLAGLTFESTRAPKKILLADFESDNSPATALLDSLTRQGYALTDPYDLFPHLRETNTVVNYWPLLQSLGDEKKYDIIVVSTQRVEMFRGARTSLPANVRWISVHGPAKKFALQSVRNSEGKYHVRSGKTNQYETAYTNEISQNVGNGLAQEQRKITIGLAGTDTVVDYFRAIVEALQTTTPHRLLVDVIRDTTPSAEPGYHWMLRDESINATGSMGTVIFKPIPDVPVLLSDTILANTWTITREPAIDLVLNEGLIYRIGNLILNEDSVTIEDMRAMPDTQLWSKGGDTSSGWIMLQERSPEVTILLMFFVLLFIERIISQKRRQ